MALYMGLYDELPTGNKDGDRKGSKTMSVEYNPSMQFVAPVLLRKKAAVASATTSKPKPKPVTLAAGLAASATSVQKADFKPMEIQEPFIQPSADFSLAPVEDEYDPFKPNDYEEYLQAKIKEEQIRSSDSDSSEDWPHGEREKKRHRDRDKYRDRDRDKDRDRVRGRDGERDRVRDSHDSRRKGDRAINPAFAPPPEFIQQPKTEPPKPNINLNESAAEAIARRLAMSKKGNGTATQAAAAGGPGSEAYGARLEGPMGWKNGQGLGSHEQDVSLPLEVQRIGPAMATIGKGEGRAEPLRNATRVVLLENMVGPGEVDDDLQPEVQEECMTYGAVVKCVIFEVPGGLVPQDQAVRIFVEFERIESARKALLTLNGRFFGGRTVRATFYSEDKFAQLDLAPVL